MVKLSQQTIKLHCLQVYKFIAQTAKEAENEMEIIKDEFELNTVITRLTLTLGFSNKIIENLTSFTHVIVNDINELQKVNPIQPKNETPVKRSKFSLKKEKDPEYTQDEFLEIYKIDMTEDVNTPFSNNNVEGADLNEKSDSQSDKSDDNDSTTTEILINENVSDEGEQEILNNITCDSSIFDSDSDSGHSLFSTTTVVLHNNLSKIEKIENECNNKEKESAEEDIEVEENEISDCNITSDILQLRECHVLLNDCLKQQKSGKNVSESDQEMRSIENLINLENLNRKRKLDEENVVSKQPKKIRSKDKSVDEVTIKSDEDDTDCSDLDRDDVILGPLAEKFKSSDPATMLSEGAKKTGVDILQMLLECIGNEHDSLAATEIEDSSDWSTDVDKNQNKTLVADKKTSSKEQDENDKRRTETSDDVIEGSSSDKEKQKRKQWRRDRLLTEKLTDGSTDEEKEDNPEERRRPRRKRRTRAKSEIDLKSYSLSSNSDTDKAIQGDDSSADNLSIVSLCFSSDSTSDNDIEFVKAFPTNCKEEEENNDDQSKTGRRNIRMVKSDALLTATTKKAQKEEEERRERLHSQSQLLSQVETEELVLDIDKETKKPLIAVDSNITQRLKAHQKEGVRFMWNNCYENVNAIKENKPGTGCILAHCMGLGKSLQVVALINTLFSHEITNTKHVVIICPLSTVLNWENEFKICDDIAANKKKINRFLITDGKTKQERHRVIIDWNKIKGVLILGYDSFHSLLKTSEGNKTNSVPKIIVEALLDPGPDLVICDEGHLIKNGRLNRAKTLAKIKTKRRIILTGTPMQNNLVEYFYMVDFVKPNLLGTKKEFSNRFINPIDNGRYDDSTETDIKLMRQRSHVLHDYLKDSIQRYELTELQQYIPAKLDYVLFIEPSSLQIELYKTCLEEVQVNALMRRLFTAYTKLRDIWTHPCLLKIKEQNKAATQNKRKEVDTIAVEPEIAEDPGEWWHSKCPDDLLTNIEYGPKMMVMLEIIEHSVRLGDKLVIFGSQLSLLDAIEYFLQENGWRKNESYLRMDGTVSPDIRVSYCNKFNRKNQNQYKLFLLSVQVGGLGLNLTAANRIILMDVNFNPAHDTQSIFRTYRFGQEKRCYVYRLVSIGTMEEVIYERSVTKLAVSLRVVDEHQISRHYKFNDLQEMYRFNIYSDKERPVIKLPVDEVLAFILEKCKRQIFKYHEHQHLLENRPEEQLNEDEQRLAWDEFRREQEAAEQQVAANIARLQNLRNLQNPTANAPSVVTNPYFGINSNTITSNVQLASNTITANAHPSVIVQQQQALQPATTAVAIRPEIIFTRNSRPFIISKHQRKLLPQKQMLSTASTSVTPHDLSFTSTSIQHNPSVIASTANLAPSNTVGLSKVGVPSTSKHVSYSIANPTSNIIKQQHINIIPDANRSKFGKTTTVAPLLKQPVSGQSMQKTNLLQIQSNINQLLRNSVPLQQNTKPRTLQNPNFVLRLNRHPSPATTLNNVVRPTLATTSGILSNGVRLTSATSSATYGNGLRVTLDNDVRPTAATTGGILSNGVRLASATSSATYSNGLRVTLDNDVRPTAATTGGILSNGVRLTSATASATYAAKPTPATTGAILSNAAKPTPATSNAIINTAGNAIRWTSGVTFNNGLNVTLETPDVALPQTTTDGKVSIIELD